jgi:glycosyltransferase involved in cell wall biosynthesis
VGINLKELNKLKVAIVCDWITGIGGAERVVFELHNIFPEAPIYTSQYNPKDISLFENTIIKTGWMQKIPSSLKKFLPILRAAYFSNLNLDDYDLVISASGAEAKGVKTGKNTIHIDYCHSPTHYYWSRYDDYMKNPGFGKLNPIAKIGLKLFVGPMRRWDKKAALRPDYIIANSSHTKNMIKKYYGRDSKVIYPPVDVDRFTGKNIKRNNELLIIGRQTPYKKIDLAIMACNELGIKLNVIGDGPENNNLKNIAGPKIKFYSGLSDKKINEYFETSKGFIFPGLDDFGIVAVEALASGMPVIAFKGGGALDYIKPGVNGLFFDDQSVDSLKMAIMKFNKATFKEISVKESAEEFSVDLFHSNIVTFIDNI